MGRVTYKDAGVDLDVYEQSMSRLPRWMQRTFSPRVLRLDGGFAGLFELDFDSRLFARNYERPVLVACTDGVGTKLKVAQLTQRHHTVGLDLVAMCVNDAICCGAEPLFFLDYVAMGEDDSNRLEQIVQGISEGCVQADCALIGGETAVMPDMYTGGAYDLAGFCVGVVERKNLINGSAVQTGDVVLGLASSGLHSNGYSLVRHIVFEHVGLGIDDPIPSMDNATVGDVLLTPTRIYAASLRKVLTHYRVKNVVHSVAHITGGGIQENLERVLPAGARAVLDRQSWTMPPVFPWLQELGGVDDAEMFRVFNMGLGLVLVVSAYYAENIQRMLTQAGETCWRIGEIIDGDKGVDLS